MKRKWNLYLLTYDVNCFVRLYGTIRSQSLTNDYKKKFVTTFNLILKVSVRILQFDRRKKQERLHFKYRLRLASLFNESPIQYYYTNKKNTNFKRNYRHVEHLCLYVLAWCWYFAVENQRHSKILSMIRYQKLVSPILIGIHFWIEIDLEIFFILRRNRVCVCFQFNINGIFDLWPQTITNAVHLLLITYRLSRD